MRTVHVAASREYDVLIERGLLDRAGAFIAPLVKGRNAVIVSDDRVFALYGERLAQSFASAGFTVFSHVLPHGEQSKDLQHFGELLEVMVAHELSRSDVAIALGGGVIGDLTGFAAASYQRGMAFVQVPTTLLAAVDSSVGGKTAVNLPSAKNQVGSFYQPSIVLCDPAVIETLPEEEYRCGCAEIIKYGLLEDADFFLSLKMTPVREQLESVIAHCVTMKRDVVAEDEYDLGRRQTLNLGHTIGHGIEACSKYEVLHGQAVAIGMATITRAAAKRDLCEGLVAEQVNSLLQQYGLPTETPYTAHDLAAAILSDKKRAGDTIHFIVPRAIGKCTIETVNVTEIEDWLHDGGIQ